VAVLARFEKSISLLRHFIGRGESIVNCPRRGQARLEIDRLDGSSDGIQALAFDCVITDEACARRSDDGDRIVIRQWQAAYRWQHCAPDLLSREFNRQTQYVLLIALDDSVE
jgi:hypothetical protein